MLSKLLFSIVIAFLLIDMGNQFECSGKKIRTKNSLINKFCIATLKTQLDIKKKQNLDEISDFTCECFFKKYNSGNSIKNLSCLL